MCMGCGNQVERQLSEYLSNDEVSGADVSGNVHEAERCEQLDTELRYLVDKGVQQLGAARQHTHRINDQLQKHST